MKHLTSCSEEREHAIAKALLRLEKLGFFESSSARVAEAMNHHARSVLVARWGGPLRGPRKLDLFPDHGVHDFPALCLTAFGFEIEHVPRDENDLAENYLLRAFEGSFGLLGPKSLDVQLASDACPRTPEDSRP
ncbi:MAG: hypothetical protein ACOC1F_09420 [Myxococcota bacterium]